MKYRIYPSIGIARLGNGKANKEDVIFSPEIPWANLYETDNNYLSDDGALKKQAQRFYIYECDELGNPIKKINADDFEIEWTAEVANKKPFWYDFNNCLDLSVQFDNQNLSPNFYDNSIAPGISTSYRNPNVLDQKPRNGGPNYRQELVNNPPAVTVSAANSKLPITGSFPNPLPGKQKSKLAQLLSTTDKSVNLGTMEYDNGDLIFYGADGHSASLNPSDLNTDFADNSNWYDDICDGRITAKITNKKNNETIELSDAASAAWITSAPPDYAPQIQPISTMYDLICGAANQGYTTDFSLIFPMFYRLYRMQWVNLGDFLSPSFRETIDELIKNNEFEYLYSNARSGRAKEVRVAVFNLFRNPHYDYNNEPIIPSKDKTSMANLGSGTEELKLPYYPGDGINYPGSPAQWFAIPPLLYDQLKQWRDGNFTPLEGSYASMDAIGQYYQGQFATAAQDPAKAPLLMNRAVLDTLYGGGFHPGVELTWPFRHEQLYAQNTQTFTNVHKGSCLYGLREIRLNAATPEQQADIFYNDFGFEMNAQDVSDSLQEGNAKAWLWQITPGDLTKWMGIPWQSDAGSCQAVFTDSQYPVPAWWAANLPVDVLTEASLVKMRDSELLESTRQNIYANRLPWLQTTDTGFVGYHAEGGYMNGLISMVYQWKDIGVVTGRNAGVQDMPGVPDTVYVSFDSKNRKDKLFVFLGKAVPNRPAQPNPPTEFYTNTRENVWIPKGKTLLLASKPNGTGQVHVDDKVVIKVNGTSVYEHDYSNGCSGRITPLDPTDVTSNFAPYADQFVNIEISYYDTCGGVESSSEFYLVFQ